MTDVRCRMGLFETDRGPLALSAESLLAVLEQPRIFPLPGVFGCLPGVLWHERQPVPLVAWSDEDAWQILKQTRYVAIVSTGFGRVGLPVERVGQVVEGVAVSPGPGDMAGMPGVVGGFECGQTVYPLLDIDNLVEQLPERP